jgi:hypothetical protein
MINKKTLKEINDLLLSISVDNNSARRHYFAVSYDEAIKDNQKEMMYWFGQWRHHEAQLQEIELFDKFGIEYTVPKNIERMRKDIDHINEHSEFAYNEYKRCLEKEEKEVA